jgi:hypothetical protein
MAKRNRDLGRRLPLAQEKADEMEGILADVDAKRGDGGGLGFGYADHGVGSLHLFPSVRGRPSHGGHWERIFLVASPQIRARDFHQKLR